MSWRFKKKHVIENHVTELKLVYKLQCLEKQLHRIIIGVEQKIMTSKYNSANVLTPEQQMRIHANQFLFCIVTLEWKRLIKMGLHPNIPFPNGFQLISLFMKYIYVLMAI